MRIVDVIEKKKQGQELSEEEIRTLIAEYTAGSVPDYQMSAFAMAVWFRGMTMKETTVLTDAMAHSGDCENLSVFGRMTVDKHSTGGVGDKTTMIVGPIVASLGAKVAKVTGRGLGHTGGTADKLESVPGLCITMDRDQFEKQLNEIGIAVISQSENMTPADKKLYALRDVTATVDSIPLIASSVMSKKLAAGAANIVLDVKYGSGAFMQTPEDARILAEKMVSIGTACGRNVAAVLTNMDVPLGSCIGNALEVREAVELLKGKDIPDLREVCLVLAANMLRLVHGWDVENAKKKAAEAIDSGKAFETMKKWIAAQGGDVRALDDFSMMKQPEYSRSVCAAESAYLSSMNARLVGEASAILGAGRMTKQDEIDHAAGIVLKKKPGDYVRAGEEIAVLCGCKAEAMEEAEERFRSACAWSAERPEEEPMVYAVICGEAVK